MNFPVQSSELTPAWLTEELRRSASLGDAQVVRFDAQPVSQRGGTADVYIVSLDYDRATTGPAKLIAKFSSTNPTVRAAVRDYRLYQREVAFYARYAEGDVFDPPRCYAAHHDPAADTCVLLLEYIEDAHAREISDTAPAEIALVVSRLAAFHARWWGRAQDLPDLEWESSPALLDLKIGKVTRALARLAPEFRAELGEPAAAILDLWLAHARELADYTRQRPLTMCHGSLHRGQILFSDDPAKLRVIDWQSVAVDLGANDLARVVVTGLRPDQRNACEAQLLASYHRTLIGRGVVGYSLEQLRDDYRLGLANLLVFHSQIFADYPVAIVAKHWKGETSVWNALFRSPGEAAAQHDTLGWLQQTLGSLRG